MGSAELSDSGNGKRLESCTELFEVVIGMGSMAVAVDCCTCARNPSSASCSSSFCSDWQVELLSLLVLGSVSRLLTKTVAVPSIGSQ